MVIYGSMRIYGSMVDPGFMLIISRLGRQHMTCGMSLVASTSTCARRIERCTGVIKVATVPPSYSSTFLLRGRLIISPEVASHCVCACFCNGVHVFWLILHLLGPTTHYKIMCAGSILVDTWLYNYSFTYPSSLCACFPAFLLNVSSKKNIRWGTMCHGDLLLNPS